MDQRRVHGELEQSSARGNTCRLYSATWQLANFLWLSSFLDQVRLPDSSGGNSEQSRDQRSLTNTFPFNTAAGRGGHHGGHHDGEHHGHHEEASSGRRSFSDVAARDQRQRGGDDTPVDFGSVAAARPGNDGKRCIDKVEMIEETEYDEVVQCDHSSDRRCHTTYVI